LQAAISDRPATNMGLHRSSEAELMFNAKVISAIQQHARAEYPRESCGIVSGDEYIPLQNAHRRPQEAFDCSEQVQPYLEAGTLQALVHSHPDSPDSPAGMGPSEADMQCQIGLDVPCGIVWLNEQVVRLPYFWGADVPIPPLVGREFRHGPSGSDGKGDCYALIRDWFKVMRDVELPDFPRNDNWWQTKEGNSGFYLEKFAEIGFRQLPPDAELLVGDVFFAAIASRVPNHGGVFVGNGLILHHLANRLSAQESAGRFGRRAMWVRHETTANDQGNSTR